MHSSGRLASLASGGVVGGGRECGGSFPLTEYRCRQESVAPNLLRGTPLDNFPATLGHEMDQKLVFLISICRWFHRWITPSAVIREFIMPLAATGEAVMCLSFPFMRLTPSWRRPPVPQPWCSPLVHATASWRNGLSVDARVLIPLPRLVRSAFTCPDDKLSAL